MNDDSVGVVVAEIFMLLFFVFGLCLMHGCDRNDAFRAGHAEYYINTNNFNKEWRWKEIK